MKKMIRIALLTMLCMTLIVPTIALAGSGSFSNSFENLVYGHKTYETGTFTDYCDRYRGSYAEVYTPGYGGRIRGYASAGKIAKAKQQLSKLC